LVKNNFLETPPLSSSRAPIFSIKKADENQQRQLFPVNLDAFLLVKLTNIPRCLIADELVKLKFEKEGGMRLRCSPYGQSIING